MARYFKKPSPSDGVRLSNGQVLKFPTADYKMGYFATESPSLANELVGFAERGQFGVSEVSWTEYESNYLKKKTGTPLRPPYREEISGTKLRPNPFLELQHGAVAAVGGSRPTDPVRMRDPEAVIAPESTPEQPPAGFKPTIGRR